MKITINGKWTTADDVKDIIREARRAEKKAARIAAENNFWADFAQKMEEGIVPYVRAGEAHAARIAAEQAADEARHAAAKAFEAEEADVRAARLSEAVEVFQQMLADQKAAEEAARKEKAEIARLLQEDKKAEKAAAKKARKTANKKAAEARSFDREEARLRKERLMEAVGIFVVDEDAKDKAAEVANVPATGKEEAIASIVERIKNCSTLDASIREQIEKIWLRKQELGYEKVKVDRHILEMAIVYRNYGFDEAPLSVRRSKMVAHIDCAIAELNYELRRIKAIKLRVQQEQRALRKALAYVAANNQVDAAYVAILAEKCRVAKPKKPDAEIRLAAKIPQKERVQNFAVRTFAADVLYKEYKELRNGTAWKPEYIEGSTTLTTQSLKLLDSAREKRRELQAKAEQLQEKPFAVKHQQGTVIHLPKTMLSVCDGIEFDKLGVRAEYVVADHKTEEFFQTHPLVWTDDFDDDAGEAILADFCKSQYNRMEQNGVIMDKDVKFVCDHAGAAQLKAEKVVLCMESVRKAQEAIRYFGKAEDEFVKTNKIVGPDLEKAWANLNRPWACDLEYTDGTKGKPSDILIVKNPEYVYYHGKAISLGATYNGKAYKEGPVSNSVGLFLGQIGFFKPIKGQGGQLNGYGLKGFAYYCGGSILDEVCRRNHITREQFFDCKIQNIDGEWVRIGDYAAISTDDVWKFDKFFPTYRAYLEAIDWLKEQKKSWEIVGKLGLLRQSEDEEDAYKRRRLSRSLLQQVFSWCMEDAVNFVKPAARKVRAMMTFEGAIRKLAGLTKEEADRTPIETLFGVAPFLFANPGVQKSWRNKLRAIVKEMMGNRLETKGQYPYIIQDPVAMLEILVLGKDPKDTGVVPAGYISLADVPADVKVTAVRFPANFLTAKVMVNMPLKDVFKDLGNVCVLSIHDDILVVQDGDTDGDEICIIYSPLLARLIEQMIAEIDPPVVVFEHGTKAKASVPGTVEELRRRLAHARFNASHNDHTGIYADMARDLLQLAVIAYAHGDMDEFDKLLRMAAAASTGAIISIDQVKGNDVSEALESWLKTIGTFRSKRMGYKKPYTQQFLKKGVASKDCNAPVVESLPDAIAVQVKEQVGPYKAIMPFAWNAEAAMKAFTLDVPHKQINGHVLSKPILEFIGNTLYNDEFLVGNDGKERRIDGEFRDAVKAGKPVQMSDLLLYLWHNERALSQKQEGRLLPEKRAEYFRGCWKVIVEFAVTDMTGDLSVKTPAVKKYSAYFNTLNQALELTRNNGVNDEDGSYTMFLLNVLAPSMVAVVRKNGWKLEDFSSPSDESSESADPAAELEKSMAEQEDVFGEEEYFESESFFAEPDDSEHSCSDEYEEGLQLEDWGPYFG